MNGRAAKPLAQVATAAVDVSDGCLQDLQHLCATSGVGAELRTDTLPLTPGHAETCQALGLDPIELALTGGEDYELLFTAPSSAEAEAFATKIGDVTKGEGVDVIDANGQPVQFRDTGFRHFS